MSEHKKIALRWADGKMTDQEGQYQFWAAACKEYRVDFSWPMPLKTARALASKILIAKEPEFASVVKLHLFEGEALLSLLQGLAKKHLLPRPGTRERGRPNESETRERLRLNALIYIEKNRCSSIHWGADEKIKRIIFDNPELAPSQQIHSENSPENAVYSQYRKDEKLIEKLEEYRQKILPIQWDVFMEGLDGRKQEWIIHLSRLLHEIKPICGDDIEARDEMLDQWMGLVTRALPEPVVHEYIRLGMPVLETRLIQGLHFQEEAEATVRVDNERRKYYDKAKHD